MNNKFLFAVFFSFVSVNLLFAETPMHRYLAKLKIIENGNGRSVKTFEDVKIKLNPFQEGNKPYPIVGESELPDGYVSKETAKKFFKKLSSHAILTDEKTSFKDFMNEHFSLDNGNITGFPQIYKGTDPGSHTYVLTMDDDYRYIHRFNEYSPDAVSCTSDRSLCDSCGSSHRNKKNIYANFRETVLSKADINNAEVVDRDSNYIKMEFKPRTPPRIYNDGSIAEETDNFFPVLGGDVSYEPCTSSDWYKVPKGLLVDDSYTEPQVFFARFSFGRFSECPKDGTDWKDFEQWNAKQENILKIDWTKCLPNEKPYFRDVVKFDNFDGFIRYSIFAKATKPDDTTLPVNPSINVIENRPDIGYGYPTAGDLGDSIETAKDWPEKNGLGTYNRKGYLTGLIRVHDNDLPNIIIRVTNVDTEEQMFFPPCVASSECKISLSSKYKAVCGIGKTNKDEYDYFVQNLGPDYNFKALNNLPDLDPYYTIYSIEDQNIKTATEKSFFDRLLLNKDPKFINENVRVEDYFFSDTDQNGEKTFKANSDSKVFKGSFGKKRGSTRNMVALFENTGSFRFKTGSEYRIDVWTDDNVKWSNIEYPTSFDGGPEMHYENVRNTGVHKHPHMAQEISGNETKKQLMVGKPQLLEYAKVYDTGIKKGFIQLTMPHASENLNETEDIDITKHINGGIYFTPKDPTASKYNLKTVEDLENNQFPSITVVAEDYAGLKRQLRLFFRVDDGSIDLKALEESIK